MTVEYVLLLTATVFLILKAFLSAPSKAFVNAGPRLGARVERHLSTGAGYPSFGKGMEWEAPR